MIFTNHSHPECSYRILCIIIHTSLHYGFGLSIITLKFAAISIFEIPHILYCIYIILSYTITTFVLLLMQTPLPKLQTHKN